MSRNKFNRQNQSFAQDRRMQPFMNNVQAEASLGSTAELLTDLASKFNLMRTLQNLVMELFNQDQSCCLEFLETIMEELRGRQQQNFRATPAGNAIAQQSFRNNQNNAGSGPLHGTVENLLRAVSSAAAGSADVRPVGNQHSQNRQQQFSSAQNSTNNTLNAGPPGAKKKKKKCLNCQLYGHTIETCRKRNVSPFVNNCFSQGNDEEYQQNYSNDGSYFHQNTNRGFGGPNFARNGPPRPNFPFPFPSPLKRNKAPNTNKQQKKIKKRRIVPAATEN